MRQYCSDIIVRLKTCFLLLPSFILYRIRHITQSLEKLTKWTKAGSCSSSYDTNIQHFTEMLRIWWSSNALIRSFCRAIHLQFALQNAVSQSDRRVSRCFRYAISHRMTSLYSFAPSLWLWLFAPHTGQVWSKQDVTKPKSKTTSEKQRVAI